MRIVFIGTGEIGVPTLQMLQGWPAHELVGIVTQPDKPAGRDHLLKASEIKKAVYGVGIPVLQPKRIRDSVAISAVSELSPDVIVVMAYGQILPRPVLETARIACVNLHASLLPRWRGAAPIQAAIAAGDRQTGITVMYMDEGLDTGDVLLKHEVDINEKDTAASLHDRLSEIAPRALSEAIELLDQGHAPRSPQDSAQATYGPKLTREHGRIDWKESAEVIERKVRAFDPWPGAFTFVSDQSGRKYRLKILRADCVALEADSGEVVRADAEGLIVAAGKGALVLRQVQLEGKLPMSSTEFIRGHGALLKKALGE